MLIENLEHLDLNGALRVHGACDKGTDLLRKEWIIRQRNESSIKGTDRTEGGLEHLGVIWSNKGSFLRHMIKGWAKSVVLAPSWHSSCSIVSIIVP